MADVTQALLDLEARRYGLMADGDAEALADLLAEELLYLHSSGQLDGKQEYLEPIRTGVLKYLTVDHVEEQVTIVGEVAVVLGTMEADVLLDGVERKVRNQHMVVWTRQAGEWKVLAYHPAPVR